MLRNNRYVIISPVRDEEEHIVHTIRTVIQQSVLPTKWIVVDDGSRDRTPSIVKGYVAQYPWILLTSAEQRLGSTPASRIISAFNCGCRLIDTSDYDFIVKADCDLEFPANYFEALMTRFHQDEKLGIASGVYVEQRRGSEITVQMPAYHAAGASKMVRARCFHDIGGFVPVRGWDTIDEIRAQMKGWKTCHFSELKIQHLKCEGSRSGYKRTSSMQGEVYYLTGGGTLFFILKVLHRLVCGRPILLDGLALFGGFIKAKLRRRVKIVARSEARFYRQLLNKRIREKLIYICTLGTSRPKGSLQY
jgi:biofilm PGA synthesis N-glycosyltransferase PgaC